MEKRIAGADKIAQICFVPGAYQGEAEKHIEKLANTVCALAAEVNPSRSMFWVADLANPLDAACNAAMIEYQEAVAAYRAGGVVGMPYKGKVRGL